MMCETMTFGIRCTLVFLAVLMLAFFTMSAPFCVFASTEADARSAIVAAENEVVDCYRAVLDAEKTGANVTDLTSTLNEAGGLLSKANLAYSMDNFTSARNFALQSQAKLNGFVAEADALKETAMQERYWDFMVNVVGSAVGAVAVVVGGFAVWNFLKRKYDRVEARS